MANRDEDICTACGRGRLHTEMQPISFLQWTNKGYLSCRAIVPMLICDQCDAKSIDEAAEEIIERTVQAEYDKLR